MIRRPLLVLALAAAGFSGCGSADTAPPAPKVRAVVVSPTTATIVLGNSVSLVATVDAEAGTSTAVTWSSNNPFVATVSTSGIVTTLASGTAIISAQSAAAANVSGSATITVISSISAVTIAPSAITVNVGTQGIAKAQVSGVGGATVAQSVTWESSGATYFTVSSEGVVTGTSVGSAGAIRARSALDPAKVSLDVPVSVTPCTVRAVSIAPAVATLQRTQVVQFTAALDADACASHDVIWSSSNTSVVTVSSVGLVTALALGGPVTITATSVVDGTKTATASVTVVDPCTTSAVFDLSKGATAALSAASCLSTLVHTYGDWYSYTTTTTTLLEFRLAATAFPPLLAPIVPPNGGFWYNRATGYADLYILVGNATTKLFAGTVDSSRTGAYTLTAVADPPLPPCTPVYAATGVTRSFVLGTCPYAPQGLAGTFNAQQFLMNLTTGNAVSVHVSALFSPLIEIRDGVTGAVLASSSAQTGSTVSVSYVTTPATYAPIVYVTSRVAGQTGQFSITIDP